MAVENSSASSQCTAPVYEVISCTVTSNWTNHRSAWREAKPGTALLPRLYSTRSPPKGVFKATQLNSTRRRVELSYVAINTPLQNQNKLPLYKVTVKHMFS